MHGTLFFIYLCIGYLLVMYSILKNMFNIKLAFILVILSIAWINVVEMKDPVHQESADLMPLPGIHSIYLEELPATDRSDQPVAVPASRDGVSSLGDLRLYIEL